MATVLELEKLLKNVNNIKLDISSLDLSKYSQIDLTAEDTLKIDNVSTNIPIKSYYTQSRRYVG